MRNGQGRTCGECEHWVKDSSREDPGAVILQTRKVSNGKCLHSPPQVSFANAEQKSTNPITKEVHVVFGVTHICDYTPCPENYPACSQFKDKSQIRPSADMIEGMKIMRANCAEATYAEAVPNCGPEAARLLKSTILSLPIVGETF